MECKNVEYSFQKGSHKAKYENTNYFKTFSVCYAGYNNIRIINMHNIL